MLIAKDIHKNYGELAVLKGISLEIQTKQITCIVGASGAGKSTLLHILGTLDHADQGELYLCEMALHQLSEKQSARFRNQHLGFIFQFHNLLPEFSALENVCLPAFIAKKNQQITEKKATELLQLLGLSSRLQHKPNQLSGGEQQRVAVARALINSPDMVFADEPSGNLDSRNAEDLHQLFFRLRDELGQTFVIVTHNLALAQMSDRLIELSDGKILKDSAV